MLATEGPVVWPPPWDHCGEERPSLAEVPEVLLLCFLPDAGTEPPTVGSSE